MLIYIFVTGMMLAAIASVCVYQMYYLHCLQTLVGSWSHIHC